MHVEVVALEQAGDGEKTQVHNVSAAQAQGPKSHA